MLGKAWRILKFALFVLANFFYVLLELVLEIFFDAKLDDFTMAKKVGIWLGLDVSNDRMVYDKNIRERNKYLMAAGAGAGDEAEGRVSRALEDDDNDENEFAFLVKEVALSTARAGVTVLVGLRNALVDVLEVFDLSSDDEKAATASGRGKRFRVRSNASL